MNSVIKIISRLVLKTIILCMSVMPAYSFVNFLDQKDYILQPDLTSHKELVFVTSNDFPPFNYINSNSDLVGYHLDLVRLICEELGVSEKCLVKALPWKDLTKQIVTGQAQAVIAGMVENSASRKIMDFSEQYLRFPARFLANKEIWPYDTDFTNEKLRGAKIGVVANSNHARLAKVYFKNSDIIISPNEEALFADLYSGRVALAFGDGFKFSQWLNLSNVKNCCEFVGSNYWAPHLLSSGLSIGIKKNDKKLLYAINFALYQLEKNGKLEELYLKYFPISFIALKEDS